MAKRVKPHIAAKVDSNQTVIVEALRRIGASVQSLASVGHGCPDLLVGYRGECYVLEIKDGSKPSSQRKLTPDETKWCAQWRGQYDVVTSWQQAFDAIGIEPE